MRGFIFFVGAVCIEGCLSQQCERVEFLQSNDESSMVRIEKIFLPRQPKLCRTKSFTTGVSKIIFDASVGREGDHQERGICLIDLKELLARSCVGFCSYFAEEVSAALAKSPDVAEQLDKVLHQIQSVVEQLDKPVVDDPAFKSQSRKDEINVKVQRLSDQNFLVAIDGLSLKGEAEFLNIEKVENKHFSDLSEVSNFLKQKLWFMQEAIRNCLPSLKYPKKELCIGAFLRQKLWYLKDTIQKTLPSEQATIEAAYEEDERGKKVADYFIAGTYGDLGAFCSIAEMAAAHGCYETALRHLGNVIGLAEPLTDICLRACEDYLNILHDHCKFDDDRKGRLCEDLIDNEILDKQGIAVGRIIDYCVVGKIFLALSVMSEKKMQYEKAAWLKETAILYFYKSSKSNDELFLKNLRDDWVMLCRKNALEAKLRFREDKPVVYHSPHDIAKHILEAFLLVSNNVLEQEDAVTKDAFVI